MNTAGGRPPGSNLREKILGVASPPFLHNFIGWKGILICQNQSSPKNLRLFNRWNPARFGGAPAAGQRASRFATVHTRAPVSRRRRRKSPRPKRWRGADANIRRTRPFATAATAGWVKRNLLALLATRFLFLFTEKVLGIGHVKHRKVQAFVGSAFLGNFQLTRDPFDG